MHDFLLFWFSMLLYFSYECVFTALFGIVIALLLKSFGQLSALISLVWDRHFLWFLLFLLLVCIFDLKF